MSLEENKAIVRGWIEAYNKHNLDLFDEFISPNYINHTDGVDAEGERQIFIMGFKAFPDWHETVEDIIAEGDKVWVHISYAGTHKGEFFGLPPTGKMITAKGVAIYRVANRKLVEIWYIVDRLDMWKQIGAIEYTEKGKKLFPEDAK